MERNMNQNKTADLVSRNKDEIYIAYIKDNYSKDVADLKKRYD